MASEAVLQSMQVVVHSTDSAVEPKDIIDIDDVKHQEDVSILNKTLTEIASERDYDAKCPKCGGHVLYERTRVLAFDWFVHCNVSKRHDYRHAYLCTQCKVAYCIHAITPNQSDREIEQIANRLKELKRRLHLISESESGLDAYQAAALCPMLHGFGIIRWDILGILVIAIAQILGCILFIKQLIDDYVASHDAWCVKEHNVAETILAMALTVVAVGTVQFSSVLKIHRSSTTIYMLIKSVYRTPCYSICDHLINRYTLIFGWSVNYIVMTLTIIGSITIIYTANSVVDLVLNSAALYFVIELDNMYVVFFRYAHLRTHLKVYPLTAQNMMTQGHRVTNAMDPSELESIVEKLSHSNTDKNFGMRRVGGAWKTADTLDDIHLRLRAMREEHGKHWSAFQWIIFLWSWFIVGQHATVYMIGYYLLPWFLIPCY
eukprot:69050_1